MQSISQTKGKSKEGKPERGTAKTIMKKDGIPSFQSETRETPSGTAAAYHHNRLPGTVLDMAKALQVTSETPQRVDSF